MFADDRHTNAEAEPSAPARALGGEERIKNARQNFAADADTVILERDQHAIADNTQANAELPCSRISRMACSAFTMRFRNTCVN